MLAVNFLARASGDDHPVHSQTVVGTEHLAQQRLELVLERDEAPQDDERQRQRGGEPAE